MRPSSLRSNHVVYANASMTRLTITNALISEIHHTSCTKTLLAADAETASASRCVRSAYLGRVALSFGDLHVGLELACVLIGDANDARSQLLREAREQRDGGPVRTDGDRVAVGDAALTRVVGEEL